MNFDNGNPILIRLETPEARKELLKFLETEKHKFGTKRGVFNQKKSNKKKHDMDYNFFPSKKTVLRELSKYEKNKDKIIIEGETNSKGAIGQKQQAAAVAEAAAQHFNQQNKLETKKTEKPKATFSSFSSPLPIQKKDNSSSAFVPIHLLTDEKKGVSVTPPPQDNQTYGHKVATHKGGRKRRKTKKTKRERRKKRTRRKRKARKRTRKRN